MKRLAVVGSTIALMATAGTMVYFAGEKEFRLAGHGIVRFTRTAFTVLQISYDYKKSLWNVDKLSEKYKELLAQVHTRSANQLRDLCFRNAGLYIKVGQHLGSLDYLLPPEYVQVLKVFHHSAPRSSLADIQQVFVEELQVDPAELFHSFDSQPLAAASLAQVHKAVLKNGRTVAVKVQHKDIRDHSSSDVKAMEFLVNVVKRLFPEFQFSWLVEETKKNLPLELDFLNEGRNSEKLQEKLSKLAYLKVPEVVWEYSTKRILTMEYCEGGHVNDLHYMKEHNISSDEVSSKVGRIYSEMIFVQGCIHCDPHPGNILIRRKSNGIVEIIMLDHGLYHMRELRNSVSIYLSDISSILNRVPRQLILILKTNDLLRGIDHQLQTSKASQSFVTMSKCCAEAVAREELRTSGNWVERLKVYCRWSVTNAQIALYRLSVQKYSLPSDVWASVAANLISLSMISLLIGIS